MQFSTSIKKMQACLFSLCLCFTLIAWAAGPAGKVLKVDGVVVAMNQKGDTRVLKRGDDLFAKETIKTDDTSTIVMRYVDGTVVQLQKASAYVVNEFAYDENTPEKDSFSAELLKGGFRSITGKIGSRSPQSFETRARQTTLTVRGTEFEGALPPCPPATLASGGSCLNCLWHVTLGSIEIQFQGKITPLVAGSESAGYQLQDGVITLTRIAPPGTGNAAYNNEPLQLYISSQPSTTPDPGTESTVTTGSTGATGGGGGGGSDPCSALQAIKTQIAH